MDGSGEGGGVEGGGGEGGNGFGGDGLGGDDGKGEDGVPSRDGGGGGGDARRVLSASPLPPHKRFCIASSIMPSQPTSQESQAEVIVPMPSQAIARKASSSGVDGTSIALNDGCAISYGRNILSRSPHNWFSLVSCLYDPTYSEGMPWLSALAAVTSNVERCALIIHRAVLC